MYGFGSRDGLFCFTGVTRGFISTVASGDFVLAFGAVSLFSCDFDLAVVAISVSTRDFALSFVAISVSPCDFSLSFVAISVLTRDLALSLASVLTCVVELVLEQSFAVDSAAKGSFLLLFFVESLEACAIESDAVIEAVAVSHFFEEPRAVGLAGVITGVLSPNFLPDFAAGVKTLAVFVGVSAVGTEGELVILDAVSSSLRFEPRFVCFGVVEVVEATSTATSGSSAVEKVNKML